jgi:hypothetical protein
LEGRGRRQVGALRRAAGEEKGSSAVECGSHLSKKTN